jgi:hypothetical protein
MLMHFAAESVRDFMGVALARQRRADRPGSDEVHLEAALAFILRSIAEGKGRASSKAYQIGKGWLPPYRETTGYIIPTLLDLAEHAKRPDLATTAERMGEWLAEVQEPDGGFMERDLQQDIKPIVFNTGQILHGFNSLIMRRGRQDLVGNARRAGEFIVASADASGSFVRNEHFNMPHAYNVRSAWALLTLGRLLEEGTFEKVALANADWTVAQQNAHGFYASNSFQPGRNANTHGLAYVMQGLLEIHCISGQERYLESVRRAAEKVVSIYGSRGRIAGELGSEWEFLATHLCLTGYAQLAIVLYKLYEMGGEERYLTTANALLADVAATQDVTSANSAHYGGIKGSLPVYGRYAPLQYPNWATKFFIDALLAKKSALAGVKSRQEPYLSAS